MAAQTRDLRMVLASGLIAAVLLLLAPFTMISSAGFTLDDSGGTLGSPGSRTLRVGWPDLQPDIQTLNPLFAVFDAEIFVIWSCYSTLLTKDVDGDVIGDLAVEWDILPDGLTWHFEIVETARFYDRTISSVQQSLTVADVIFTYWLVQNTTNSVLRQMFPEIPSSGGRLVEQMWANGDYEMWIKLRIPYAPFVSVLSSVPILPQYVWSSQPADWSNYDWTIPPCVGSGPWYYGLDAEPDSGFVLLNRSPTWFGTVEYGWQLHVNQLFLRSETDDSNLANYLGGVNDVMRGVTQTQFISGGLVGAKWQSSQGLVFEFNMNQLTEEDRDLFNIGNMADYNSQLLQDPVVKRALQMSIDKDAVVTDALDGLGKPADSLVPESSPWRYDYGGTYAPPGETEIPFDTLNARLLLYANGWKYRLTGEEILPTDFDYLTYSPLSKSAGSVATDTLQFRFVTPDTDSFFTEASSLIQQWADQTGIDLIYSTESIYAMNSIWYRADYDTWYWDWTFTPKSEPSVDIMKVLTTEAIGSWSDVFWSNETYDALYDESLTEFDASVRYEILAEMQRMAYKESGCWPVAWFDTLYAGQSVSPEFWQNYGNWTEKYPLTIDSGYPWLFTQIYPADNPSPQITEWMSFYEGVTLDPIAFTATAVDSNELEFMWNFGDDTKSEWLDSPNVTHIYSEDGFFDAWLIVREVGTLDGFITSDKAVVRALDPTQYPPSDLDFTYEPSNPDTGSLVFFNGTAVDADGDPLIFTWDFGDGRTANGQNVTHQFSVGAGSYEVTMGVDDGHFGLEPRPVYLTKTVTVSGNSAPWIDVPDLTVVQWKVPWEFEVLSGDLDMSDDLLFTWDWGDGSPLSVTTTNATWHTYSIRMAFNLTVWCDDQTGLDGHNVSDSGYVTMGGTNHAPVITDFHVSNDMPFAGEIVTFYGTATDDDGDLLEFTLEYGDGLMDTIVLPTVNSTLVMEHIYASAGVFLAYLNVSDGQVSTTWGSPLMIDVQPVDVLPPVAVATVSPNPAVAGEVVTLNASGSSDDSGIVDYLWTFMDGGIPVELHGMIVNYTFTSEPQSVLITLNVTDAEGNWDAETVTLEVAGQIPEMPLMPAVLAVVAILALLGAVRRGRRDWASP